MLTSRRRDESGGLVERDDVLARVGELLAGGVAGRGGTLLVSGPPGIGKTRVMDASVALAAQSGMRILRARGSETEREFPFSGALQLLERTVATLEDLPASLLSGAAALARPVLEGHYLAGTGGPVPSAVHGLFWLTVNLAQESPLAILVDDLHVVDDPTLAYLLYLHRRIADLPVVVLAATRPADPLARASLSELVYEPAVEELELGPLSEAGVSALVRAEFDPEADPEFCQACARVSGGNPFYLKEALQSLREEGAVASRDGARRLSDVEPHAITRSVLLRLARLKPPAHRLARAVAVLGPGASLELAAAVAELPVADAWKAADALAGAAILEEGAPLHFTHALIGAALLGDTPAGEQAALHQRAADLLDSDHAPVERIASHLLLAPARRQERSVEVLAAAAEHALRAGLPATAVAYLKRALAEPPATRERRANLLGLLTRAELGTDPAAAAAHLDEKRALGVNGRAAAQLQLELGRTLYVHGDRPAAASALLAGARMLEPSDPLARELAAWYLSASMFDARARPRALEMATALSADPPTRLTSGERMVLAQLALERVMAGDPLREVADQVAMAWGDGELLRETTADDYSWVHVSFVYLWGGDFPRAIEIAEAALQDAQARGSVMAFATASCVRSWGALWHGRLLDALGDAEAAMEVHARDGWNMFIGTVRAIHAETLLELGDLEGAEAILAPTEDSRFADSAELAFLLLARAKGHLAQDRPKEAIADIERLRRESEALALSPPRVVAWWDELAVARARLGEREAALEALAEGEAIVRRAELRGMIARVLVNRARLEEPKAAELTLREAIAVSEESPAQLDLLRARMASGALHRRCGRRAAAVEELGRALELAHRIGARAHERAIRDELAVAGARPRRSSTSGTDALTAAELRTARLAAGGLTNREIAERLFVTPKTVEYHLRNTFMKLDIGSRRELAQVLESPESE